MHFNNNINTILITLNESFLVIIRFVLVEKWGPTNQPNILGMEKRSSHTNPRKANEFKYRMQYQ